MATKNIDLAPDGQLKLHQRLTMAGRFRGWADGLQKQVDHLGRSMTQNPTPKRTKEYQTRLHDCRNVERLQRALRALAGHHEAGTVPAGLVELKTRDEIGRLVHKGLDGSRGGYYSVIEADDYSVTTPAARQLQAMIDAGSAARERKRQIESLQAEIALKNIPSYFPTPAGLVELMISRAQLREGLEILEPSAGSGHIADILRRNYDETKIHCIERHESLRQLLTLKGHELVGSDFLETECAGKYDRVLMNPPFEKQADMEHVRRAFDALKPGGRLVAIMAPSFEFRSDRKSTEFRAWLEEMGAEWEPLPDGSFKSSGTGVSTRLVTIDKAKTLVDRQAVAVAAVPAAQPGAVQGLFGPMFEKAIRKPAPVLQSHAAQLSLF